jgi:hypothetical protein
MKRIVAIAVVSILVLAGVAAAGNNPLGKVAVHVKDHNAKQGCTNLPAISGCGDINTTYAGYSFDAFPVFFDLVEYQGVEYGMCWPDWTYSAAWNQCADLVIGEIVWPGDGISQTWTECHSEAIVITGWAWLYADAPGSLSVCNHPTTGVIQILDCAEGLDEPVGNYLAGVYGAEGADPCEPVMIQPTTWGAIKGMFE